jgi:hypothetical protein
MCDDGYSWGNETYDIIKEWLIELVQGKDAKKIREALLLIMEYGGADGGHHKQWLLDQLLHILADDYDQWVKTYQEGKNGTHTYTWDIGIAP